MNWEQILTTIGAIIAAVVALMPMLQQLFNLFK
jgi:hypothetical protein